MISVKDLKNIKHNIQVKLSNQAQINKFIKAWDNIMAESGIVNKSYLIITPQNIKIENYGFSMDLIAPHGLNFQVLEKLKPNIEDSIGCMFLYEKPYMTARIVKAKIITKQIESVEFKPIKLPPYEVYLGTGLDGSPHTESMLKYPHILDTGATNMGKTKLIDCILTNLICNCTSEELGLYLIQVDKCDQIIYRRCQHTRAYANDLIKALSVTNYILKILDKRTKQIAPLLENGKGTNIGDYNIINVDQKWSYIYLVIDEYASLMPNTLADSKIIKKVKATIQYNMERITQIGRSCGVYVIVGLQRATKDKLPPFCKAMMNTSISFRQVNESSSMVAIDGTEATQLSPREAIVKTNKTDFIKTTTLTSKMIVDYIDKYRIPTNQYKDNFCYQSINDMFPEENKELINKKAKINKNKENLEKKSQKTIKNIENNQVFDKVDVKNIQKKHSEMIENIKKIPNFVPYNPRELKKLNIIDKTIIPPTAPLSNLKGERNEKSNK